ncbi:hypothetical protein PR048_014216 [Dryococelus australis]|uniref:DUF4219 domain-containing protein n=1 Tax=Dryococelus australis TaxID=614101 RepID=A0ABQ9HDK8_9NEOP|nr:hypothetical protein PR048_014216 [Dryococelus australis]
MASEKVKCPLLSDNYHAWARRTCASLEQRRLWEAIDPGCDGDPEKLMPKQRTRNTDALNFIIQVVEDQYLNDLDQCACTETAWEILETIHCNFGLFHLITMLEELVTIKKKDNMTMHECMGKIQSWCRKLSVGGLNFADKAIAAFMIRSNCQEKYMKVSFKAWNMTKNHAEVEYENTAFDEDGAVATAHFTASCAVNSGATHHIIPCRELIEDSQMGNVTQQKVRGR